MSIVRALVVLGFAVLAAVPASAIGCRYFKVPKGYLEAAGGAAGNIACKKWPSLAAAQAECSATRACDGFSFGPWSGGVGGCLKKNRNAGYNGNVRYAGYHKTLMGCCAGDPGPSGQCFPPGTKSQAFKKPTMQSSINFGGVPGRAVDGNTNPNWSGKSCTHTNKEVNPWWVVNLGQSVAVSRISITNRNDCCTERLSNFSIKVGDNYKFLLNPACVTGAKQGKGTRIWPCALKGQFVAIEIPNRSQILTLCEVQVWGMVPNANGDMVEENITDGVVFDDPEMVDEKAVTSSYERAVWSDATEFAQR